MARRVEKLADGSDGFDALVTHEPFELLPDHLDALADGVGVLVGVWRMVESVRRDVDGVRRDLSAQITAVNTRLSAEIAALNTRIDNILLADRKS